jgi:hypothetical protein
MRSARWLAVALAALAIPAALLLTLVAADVLRTAAQLERDDVRFEAAPRRQADLWHSLDSLPGRPAERLLDVDEDLAFRQTMADFLQVEPGKVVVFGPRLENLKGQVQLDLTELSGKDANPKRRARLMNLLAVMPLEQYSADPVESENLLRRAVFLLRDAVLMDPAYADAKLNLELALRSAKAVSLPGTDPDKRPAEGSLSGQGRPGTGY